MCESGNGSKRVRIKVFNPLVGDRLCFLELSAPCALLFFIRNLISTIIIVIIIQFLEYNYLDCFRHKRCTVDDFYYLTNLTFILFS